MPSIDFTPLVLISCHPLAPFKAQSCVGSMKQPTGQSLLQLFEYFVKNLTEVIMRQAEGFSFQKIRYILYF